MKKMTKLSIAFAAVLSASLTGCGTSDMSEDMEFNPEQDITYTKDSRVNICFASASKKLVSISGQTLAITTVDCDKVEHLLSDQDSTNQSVTYKTPSPYSK